jgi:hypothetical protein
MWTTLIILAFGPLTMKLIVPGKINYYLWMGNCLSIGVIIFNGIIIIDLKTNHNLDRTYVLYIISSLIWIVFEATFILELAFLTFMCDKTVGGTHMTLLRGIKNLTRYFIESISL